MIIFIRITKLICIIHRTSEDSFKMMASKMKTVPKMKTTLKFKMNAKMKRPSKLMMNPKMKTPKLKIKPKVKTTF